MSAKGRRRRAEIGQEKRARTKAQLIAAAKALFSRGPWEAVTVDEVVNEAGVAKGTFYGHFNDLGELASAVADELVQSFDELIQPQRLTISDPHLRVAFGCDSFLRGALEDRPWASLVTRMARSYPAVGQGARSRLSEDLREVLKQSPQTGLSLALGSEVAFGIVLQVASAIGDGRLEERVRAGRGPQHSDRNRNIKARRRVDCLATRQSQESRSAVGLQSGGRQT